MSFMEFIKGTGGVEGDYTFGTIHIVSMLVLFLFTVLMVVIGVGKFCTARQKRIILVTFASFQIGFEILWRVVFLLLGTSWIDLWPFYACNLNGILVPLAALVNKKSLKQLFYLFGIVGAFLTFAIPGDIFCNKFLTFAILKSILQHAGLVYIPVYEFACGTFRPKMKGAPLVFLGLIIHTFNSEVVATLLGRPGDYMYFRSGMPFAIPGVPQPIVFVIFAVFVFLTLLAILDVKGTKAMLMRNRMTEKQSQTVPK